MFIMLLNALLNRFKGLFWTILVKLGLIQSGNEKLERIENNLLSSCKCSYQEMFIIVKENLGIRTVVFNTGVTNKPPLVLLHGLHSGLCFWLGNIKELSENNTVYVIDLPGFARSFKPNISNNSEEVEINYVQWLEQWRQQVGIETLFLLGHDFGGYIATLYALTHPWRVSHLILYEPWGFPILPFGLIDRSPNKKTTSSEVFPNWLSKLDSLFHFVRRLSFLSKIMPSIKWLSESLSVYKKCTPFDEYQSLCKEVEKWSGKIAYDKLSVLNVWARDPLIKRISNLNVCITFIFGSKSWFDHRTAYEVKYSRSDTAIHIIQGEGLKQIHLEKSKEFKKIILSILEQYEDEEGWIEDDWITYDQ